MCVSKMQFIPGSPGQSVGIQEGLAMPLLSSCFIPLKGMLQDDILCLIKLRTYQTKQLNGSCVCGFFFAALWYPLIHYTALSIREGTHFIVFLPPYWTTKLCMYDIYVVYANTHTWTVLIEMDGTNIS